MLRCFLKPACSGPRRLCLSPLDVVMEGAMGILLLPRPIIDFLKVQIALWPSLGFRLLIKIAQACFFDLMMSLFFDASALFHTVFFFGR